MATLRLYKFLNQKYGLAAIRDQRIKISLIHELNDPFEYFALALADSFQRRVLQNLKEDCAKRDGVICVSATWSNPLMWTHYADRHRGICLGFDVSDELFKPINYISRRLTLPALGIDDLGQMTEEKVISSVLLCKFSAWRYEREYRAFTSIKDKDEDGYAFMDFSDQMSLREVIVGAASILTRQEVSDAIGDRVSTIIVKRARLAFRSFKVVEQRNKKLW